MNKKDNQYPTQIHIDNSEYHREQEKKIKKIDDEHKKRAREEQARQDERYDDLLRLVESNAQTYASHLEDLKYEAEEKKKQKEKHQRQLEQLEEDKKNTIQENRYRKLSNVLPISSNIKQGKSFSASEYQNEINMIVNQIEKLNHNGMRNLDIEFYSPKKSKNFELTDEKNPYYFKLRKIEAKNTYRFKKHSWKPENIKYLWGSKCKVHFNILTSEETLIELKIRAEKKAIEDEKKRKKAIAEARRIANYDAAWDKYAAEKAIENEKKRKEPKAEARIEAKKAVQLSPLNLVSSIQLPLATILTKISNLFASTIGKILGFIIRKNDSKEKKEKL